MAHGRTPPVLITDDRNENQILGMRQGEGPTAANRSLSRASTSMLHQAADATTTSPMPQAETRLTPQRVEQTATVIPCPHPPVPHISRINPGSGSVTGGTEIDVFGTGFSFGQEFLLGGNVAHTLWDSDTHCVCIAPPNRNPGPVEARFGVSIEAPTQYFTYKDSRQNDMYAHPSNLRIMFYLTCDLSFRNRAVRILKTAGWVLVGCDADIVTVGVHLLQRFGMPLSLLGCASGGASAQGLAQAMEIDPEAAAIEVLKLLDENSGQGFMSIAEAVLQASDAGQTALHLSASLGFERLSKELIVRGADPNQRDINGYTALHFAALYGHVGCAQTLVQEGADGGIVNNRGHTASEIALDSGHRTLAELLDSQMTTMAEVAGFTSQRGDCENHPSRGAMTLEPSNQPSQAPSLVRFQCLSRLQWRVAGQCPFVSLAVHGLIDSVVEKETTWTTNILVLCLNKYRMHTTERSSSIGNCRPR